MSSAPALDGMLAPDGVWGRADNRRGDRLENQLRRSLRLVAKAS